MHFGVTLLHKNRKEEAAIEVIQALMSWLEEALTEMNQQEVCSIKLDLLIANHSNIYNT